MRILVDTSVWSLAFRRNMPGGGAEESELIELIGEARAQMIGPVRQELLSGIRNEPQFHKLLNLLRPFPDLGLTTADYEIAAEFCNVARKKGVQGSGTDFLICALAVRHDMAIFTMDEDFKMFQSFLPITLHTPRNTTSKL